MSRSASTNRLPLPWLAVAIFCAVAAPSFGCKSEERGIDGIGPWKLSKTTLAKQQGRCDFDRDPVWCYGQPPIKLGGHLAEVNLYFASGEPDAKLLEILIDVRACKAGEFARWLREKLGDPLSESPKRIFWKNRHAFIAAKVPSTSASCELSVVAPTDLARIEKLQAPLTAPTPTGVESDANSLAPSDLSAGDAGPANQ